MSVIPQKELRNNVGEVLRRAEAGDRFTITVSGREVAELGPVRGRTWIPAHRLADLFRLPADETLAADLAHFDAGLADPWEE